MERVYDFLENKIDLCENDCIIVGVSAGPDSMTLLYILNDLRKKRGFKIVVAHVNHNIRKESYEEGTFLKEYCNKHAIIFESMIIQEYGDDNFHNEARNIRYHFYDELKEKYGANYIMTGHHADDLMETILMRIVRGSTFHGYSGFQAMVVKDGYSLVRPLIFVTKEEIEHFALVKKIPYRIDKSNESDKYTRNRYRKKVLPFLKKENANVHEKFLEFSQTLQEYDEFINRITMMELENVYQDGFIDIPIFIKCDIVIQKRIIDYIFSMLYRDDILEIDNRHVDLVMKLINSKRASLKYNLPSDYIVVKEYNRAYFKKAIDSILPYDIELTDETYLPCGMTIKRLDICDSNGNDIMRVNSKDVTLPLRVRTRHIGDRINVMNMKESKKVSDILINAKIPINKRDTWPIVVDSCDKIIWIPKVKKSKYNRRKDEDYDIIFKCY